MAGTGNRSELTIGYFTKHGDGGVDVLPIGHLLKGQVRTLAKELGVPQAIIDKAPSAGLWPGQTDEAEMGFSYADLETVSDQRPGRRLAGAGAAPRAHDPRDRAQARPAPDAGIVGGDVVSQSSRRFLNARSRHIDECSMEMEATTATPQTKQRSQRRRTKARSRRAKRGA